MDTPPTAIIDACILYSAPIRDLIVRLAQAGLIQARWTDEIHDEWMRNVLKNNPKLTCEVAGSWAESHDTGWILIASTTPEKIAPVR